jgi:Domain of unknown function (DUF4185)
MPSFSRIFTSLIQSDFVTNGHGNLEAVIRSGDELRHWYRDLSDRRIWVEAQPIASGVVYTASLIQSDFRGSDGHGNFEVVVPVRNPSGGTDLLHYFRENSDVSTPWRPAQMVAPNIAGPGSLIQSDFRGSDGHGNFEVVVPLSNAAGGMDLWHFFRENSDVTTQWHRAQMVAADVGGPGSLIQSDFSGSDGHGNFEVVAPLRKPGGAMDLWHFYRENSDVSTGWHRGQMVAANVRGPGCLIQSDFRGSGGHGNFEVVVPLRRGNGSQLRHFFRENSDVDTPWRMGQFITDSCGGWGCIIQSDFGRVVPGNLGSGGHGNFEVLTEECSQSIVSYWHPNHDVALPWLRQKAVLPEPPPRRIESTERICQLTGEYDRSGWDGEHEPPPFAFNQTESKYQIRGTDLGVSFQHRDRTYFLFGDTWRNNQPADWTNLDLVAYTKDTDPSHGLHLNFFYNPPLISDGISQRALEVPLDGVSDGDAMLVFFSTDYRSVEGHDIMGRSVITRCTGDGFEFTYLGEFSRQKFVNVSIQRGRIDPQYAGQIGLPGGTDVLWVWGSGRYRASDVHLAVVPFANLRIPVVPGLPPRHIRYFAGSISDPRWSDVEDDATPLFCNGAVGELSVRWNAQLERYLATFNSDNPRGILLHSAPLAWGPWTQAPVMLFDPGWPPDADPCKRAGYGNFMHVSWKDHHCDHVQDYVLPSGNDGGDDVYGGEYGPYQIAHMAQRAGTGSARIFFTMSTWNPYQSMLMSARIDPEHVT